MRAALSVILPTLNSAAALPGCLVALMEGVEAGLIREVIVSDGGSSDETLKIAEAVGAVVVCGAPSRGGQLRQGSAVAGGDWLMFLHADTVFEPGWAAVVQAQMQRGRPGYFRLAFDANGAAPWLVAGWANLRAQVFGLPYGDQGLLIARTDYDAVGGYPDIPLMEDVAMARALRGKLHPMPAVARTSAAKYRAQGWLRRGARNLWTLIRYLAGSDPEALARAYRR